MENTRLGPGSTYSSAVSTYLVVVEDMGGDASKFLCMLSSLKTRNISIIISSLVPMLKYPFACRLLASVMAMPNLVPTPLLYAFPLAWGPTRVMSTGLINLKNGRAPRFGKGGAASRFQMPNFSNTCYSYLAP